MHLRPYLDSLPLGGKVALAETLGISSVYLFQLAAGQGGRQPSPELCVRLEAITERHVRRWDLRPNDWHLIWPELIGSDGAPAVADEEPQKARA